MTATAIILLIISAFTHAGWNFLSKREYPTQAFYLVTSVIGVVVWLPFPLYHLDLMSHVPLSVWITAGMSGFLLALYYGSLAGAYAAGDISIAYPLARSLPVLFVFMCAHALDRSHVPGAYFLLGILMIVGGCILLPLKKFTNLQPSNYLNRCCLMAVLAAVAIAGYTLADDMALRSLAALPGKPISPVTGSLLYLFMQATSCMLWQSMLVAMSKPERKSLTIVLKTYKRSTAITGIGIFLTYSIVLVSMNYVSNVSYVAALRQLSIPIGALMGIAFLKEPPYLPKSLGIGFIFLGLVLAAFN